MKDTHIDSHLHHAIQKLGDVSPKASFIHHIHEEVIPTLKTQSSAYPVLWDITRYLLPVGFSIVLLVLLSTGIFVASAKATPNNIFYPIKTALEQIELSLTTSPSSRAILQTKIAGHRVEEIQQVVHDDSDITQVSTLTSQYEEEIKKSLEALVKATPSGESTAQKVASELEKHTEVLKEVRSQIPTEHQEGVQRALEVSQNGQDIAQDNGNQPDNTNIQGASSASPDKPNNAQNDNRPENEKKKKNE